MNKTIFVIFLIALTASSGCYKTTFMHGDRQPSADVTEETRTYAFFGMSSPSRPYRADKICPGGVAHVETYTSVGNSFITIIALGGLIYGASTVKVTCAVGNAHNFYLDAQDRVLAYEATDEDTGKTIVENLTSDAL